MACSEMLRCVDLVRTDILEELSASFIRVTSPNLVTLMKEALRSSETSALTRADGVTYQKTPFFNSVINNYEIPL
jgi:hypothetical protein